MARPHSKLPPPMKVEYTSAVPVVLSFVTNASRLLLAAPVRSKEPAVVGKSGDCVKPTTNALPAALTAIAGRGFVARAAKKCRVLEPRIDDQFLVGVVARAHLEPVLVSACFAQDVAALHRHAHAGNLLERDRSRVSQHAQGGVDLQPARCIQRQTRRSGICQADVGNPGARPDSELVLQIAGASTQHQVDAGPELAIDDLPVSGEPGAPAARVVTAKVVEFARCRHLSFDSDPRVAVNKLQSQRDTARRHFVSLRSGRCPADRCRWCRLTRRCFTSDSTTLSGVR